MSARIIQGAFLGGAMRPQPGLVRATAGGPISPGAHIACGRPAPAFAGRSGLVQPRGGDGIVAIDAARLGLARNGGAPLPASLLAKMESAFGADFSGVRVHVGAQAARLGAVAFTTGYDLYFAPGRYQPESVQGQQLIGHELAHVIQQRQGRVRAPAAGLTVVQDPALEAEADRLGMRAALHRQPQRAGAVQARLAPGRGGAIQPRTGAVARQGPPAPAFAPRGATPVRACKASALQPATAPGRGRAIQRVNLLGGFVGGGAQNADYVFVDQNLSRAVRAEMIYLDEHATLTYQTGVVAGNLGLTVFEVQIGGVWYDLDDICNPASPNYAIGLQLDADTPMRTIITIDPALHGIAPNFHRVDASLVHEITVHAWHAAIWLRKLRSRAYHPGQLRSAWRTSNLLNPNAEHDAFGLGQNRGYGMTAQNVFQGLGGGGAPFQADVRFDQNAHNPGPAPLNLPGFGVPEFYL